MTVKHRLHHTCDRCGAEFNRLKKHGRLSHTLHTPSGQLERSDMDLCPQCVSDYRQFLTAPVHRVHKQRLYGVEPYEP